MWEKISIFIHQRNYTFNPAIGNKHGYVQKLIYRMFTLSIIHTNLEGQQLNKHPNTRYKLFFYIIMPIKICLCCAVLGRSVVSDSLPPPWTATRQAPLSMGVLQARVLEWIAMPSSRGSSQPRDQTRSPTLQVDSLLTETPGKFSLLLIFFIKQMFKMAWDMLEIC